MNRFREWFNNWVPDSRGWKPDVELERRVATFGGVRSDSVAGDHQICPQQRRTVI